MQAPDDFLIDFSRLSLKYEFHPLTPSVANKIAITLNQINNLTDKENGRMQTFASARGWPSVRRSLFTVNVYEDFAQSRENGWQTTY
jgi:hypothetical protein